jgi:hypothetical protein
MPDTTPALYTFDYVNLPAADRDVVREHTNAIRSLVQRTARDIWEIGSRLLDVKARLGHGRFLDWLGAEFDLDERTAQNFMNVARRLKSETVSDLAIGNKVLYMLAAPSVPEAAREELVARAQKGEKVTPAKAAAVVARHRRRPVPAKGPAQPSGTVATRPGAEVGRAAPREIPNVPTVRNCFGCLQDKPTVCIQLPGLACREVTKPYADNYFPFCDECKAAPIMTLIEAVLQHIFRENAIRKYHDQRRWLAATLRNLSGPWDTEEARVAAQHELRALADVLDQPV